MQNLIEYITAGATEMTPQVIVGLLMFSLILDCIGSIVHSALSIGRR